MPGRQGRVSLGIRKTEQGQRWGGVVEYLLKEILKLLKMRVKADLYNNFNVNITDVGDN